MRQRSCLCDMRRSTSGHVRTEPSTPVGEEPQRHCGSRHARQDDGVTVFHLTA
jgi:hypothetical protein